MNMKFGIPDSLISPQEAVRLYGKTSCQTFHRAAAVWNACLDAEASTYGALACIWNAGRVQGIREERARRGGGRR